MSWEVGERGGVRLACRDFGGRGSPVLLLHGLAGYAEEWSATARRLIGQHRVYALDQRGVGRSDRIPVDVSQTAFVSDVEYWLERLQVGPAALIGQSLGGLTAFLLTARRPDLVDRLVVAEATPDADPAAPVAVQGWISKWQHPFPSLEDALAFFGDTNWGRTWAAGLDRGTHGYAAAFDQGTIVRTISEASATDYWDEWQSITRPTLIVRGDAGISESVAERMRASLEVAARAVTIPDAGHDVHLEQPERWIDAIQAFL